MQDPRWLLGLLLTLSPAGLYLGIVYATAADVPRGDDFVSLLPFVSDWHESSSWIDRLALLHEQYFSHRIALTRLGALLAGFIPGHSPLLLLQAFGWLAWLFITAAIAFSVGDARRSPWLGLPVFLLLMQPQGVSNLHVAMQAVSNIGVVALALIAFWLATSERWTHRALALALSGLAAFTTANGLLVAPIIAVMWAARGLWRPTSLAAGVAGLIWVVYFTGYRVEQAAFALQDFIVNAATMAGGFANVARMPPGVGLACGGLILSIALLLVLQPRFWRGRPWHASLLVFFTLSMLMAARGRIGWGADYMTQDRYRIYGLLIMATLVPLALTLVTTAWRKRAAIASIVAAGGFSLVSFAVGIPPMLTHERWCEATAINHQLGGSFLLANDPGWDENLRHLERASRHGLYQLPAPLSEAERSLLLSLPAAPADSSPTFTVGANSSYLGYGIFSKSTGTPSPARLVLAVSQDNRVVLPLDHWRTPLPKIVTERRILGPDHAYIWPAERYVPGDYTLYGLECDGSDHLRVVWTTSLHAPSFQ